MILLRIVSSSEKKVERIAEILLKERLTAKTKSLLFSKIDKRLNAEFTQNLPEVHALPIVDLDKAKVSIYSNSIFSNYQIALCVSLNR